MALTAEQQTLAANYIPYARKLARYWKDLVPRYRDEFDSAALYALVQAAENFNPDGEANFLTFSRQRIRGALIQAYLDSKRRGLTRVRDLPKMLRLNNYIEDRYRAIYLRPLPEVGQAIEAEDSFNAIMKKLPRMHAAVCYQLYVEGVTTVVASQRLNCSQSWVVHVHNQALDLLRAG